jgi:hypothetical protein
VPPLDEALRPIIELNQELLAQNKSVLNQFNEQFVLQVNEQVLVCGHHLKLKVDETVLLLTLLDITCPDRSRKVLANSGRIKSRKKMSMGKKDLSLMMGRYHLTV